MKAILAIYMIILSNYSFAQFAIIRDKDGFCNVRTSGGKNNNIIDSLEKGHLVYGFPNNTNWTEIDYTKNKKERSGQLYKDRLMFVSNFEEIPISSKENSKIILKKEGITVVLNEQNFDKSKHKFSYYKDANDQIEFIDKKKYWGTDGGIPKTEYKSIVVLMGHVILLLPTTAFENLYEINLDATSVNYDKANDILYIQSMNGDGAGSYVVIWRVEKGIYKDKLISYGED